MRIIKMLRMMKNRIMQSANPVGWARKIGVNFPKKGGGIFVWQNKLEH